MLEQLLSGFVIAVEKDKELVDFTKNARKAEKRKTTAIDEEYMV